MAFTTRAVTLLIIAGLPLSAAAQTGPADPQVILSASLTRLSKVSSNKLSGHVIATLRVGRDGRVTEVLVTENTTAEGVEPQVVKVLQSARFRPAIDESGQPVEASAEVKIELRQSTGNEPKPVPAKPDPELNEKEKARIARMRCTDFTWEWVLLDDVSSSPATEFMPRIATTMYAAARTAAGDYVDAKVWKESADALEDAADRCREQPETPFWEGVFKPIMDEAVND